jgi:hypothetical protein
MTFCLKRYQESLKVSMVRSKEFTGTRLGSGNKMKNKLGWKVAATAAIAGGLLVAVAGPALAVEKDFGPLGCSGTLTYTQTYTFSNGTTVHVQFGSTTKTHTYDNGNNILHQYYTPGLTSVTDSTATTTKSFQSTGNGITCTS